MRWGLAAKRTNGREWFRDGKPQNFFILMQQFRQSIARLELTSKPLHQPSSSEVGLCRHDADSTD
jgi:hypothetical protein